MSRDSTFGLPFAIILAVAPLASVCQAVEPCRIEITDAASGWPVPLVELRTTHHVRFISDNAGLIALDLPELMGRETWFFVEGHGYEVPRDGFGMRGVRLTPQSGATLQVKVNRKFPAKRLGRLTGGGIYGESQKLGQALDWREQGLLGCDSVQTAVHRGRLYWLWGDTTLAKYPLGLFDMLGATTELQPLAAFQPPLRLRYEYFTGGEGQPRVVCKMPGDGPTWTSGFVSLPNKHGEPRLVGNYVKIQPPLTEYESGLCVWNEQTNRFDQHRVIWSKTDAEPKKPLSPDGHPVLWTDEAGVDWLLFGDPFPRLKCRATFEAWQDPAAWQTLRPQSAVASADDKHSITPHRGSIAWNGYRRRWVAVFTQLGGGSSYLGEIWYAEAKQPTGPWENAVKVVTHDNYTFYNPRLHPEFTADDSPILLFEGTYTKEFADHPPATPRYDYNQILYRLDLNDPQLVGN